MLLDIFKNDAFHYTQLVAAINQLPYAPTKLGGLGIFNESGVSTLTVAIERQGATLTLVPTAARGSRGPAKNPDRRDIRDLRTTHLPQSVAVMADEVIGLRSFGTEQDIKTIESLLREKMLVATTDLDITHEWHRMGALKGVILDADGTSVIYNLYTEFGYTKEYFNWALDSDTTDVLAKCVQYKRAIESKLGGLAMSGLRLECSSEFFDDFVGHPEVKDAWKNADPVKNLTDKRAGFVFGDIMFSEYRGQVGSNRYIAAGRAVPIVEGVPNLYRTVFSPAPYMDAVGQPGLPRYIKPRMMDFDVGIEYDVQSNPLHFCTRPNVQIESGSRASFLPA